MITTAKLQAKEIFRKCEVREKKVSMLDTNPTTISICGNGANTEQIQNGQH